MPPESPQDPQPDVCRKISTRAMSPIRPETPRIRQSVEAWPGCWSFAKSGEPMCDLRRHARGGVLIDSLANTKRLRLQPTAALFDDLLKCWTSLALRL